MIYFYYFLAVPLLRLGLWFASLFSTKIRIGLAQRKGVPWKEKSFPNRPIVIHAASGEFEYAKPLIRGLKAKGYEIAVTYFSPTYVKNIEATKEVTHSGPSPWETPHHIKAFLDQVKPLAYLVARTDVWPGIVHECKKRGIPTALFSATLTSHSRRMRNSLSRHFAKWSLSPLSKIFCVSKDDLEQFAFLGLNEKCIISGDTRFEQVLFRIENPRPLKLELRPSLTTLVCGSTWQEDEAVLVPTIAKFKGRLKVLIAPHEPTPQHLTKLESQLEKYGLSFSRYSTAATFSTDVLLIDQVGILADLYKWGSLAFVGGSFRKSVHSVMEPLSSGCLTLVGPYFQNNREAQSFQKIPVGEFTAVTCIHNAQELEDTLHRGILLKDDLRSAIQDEVKDRAHSTQRIISWLESLRS